MTEMQQLASLVARLEAVTKTLEGSRGGGSGDAGDDVAQQVSSYDEFIKTSFEPLQNKTKALNLTNAAKGVDMLLKLANEQRKLIDFSTKHSQPSTEDFNDMLGPMMKLGSEIEQLRDFVFHPKNKCSVYEGFFLSAMYESITAFSWLQVPLPVPHVQAMIEAVFFYTNKILKEKKDGGKEWVNAFKEMLVNLKAYVKATYTTGFMWSGSSTPEKPSLPPKPDHLKKNAADSLNIPPPPPPPLVAPPAAPTATKKEPKSHGNAAKALFGEINAKGNDISKPKGTADGYLSSGSAGSAPAPPPPPAGVPPPPPPAAVPPPQSASSSSADQGEDTRAQLMASLNKGANVTTGLKKVTDDMKTHKNPNLRMGSAVPYKKPTGATSVKPVVAAKKPVVKKPAKLALEGKTWNVEYQEGQSNLVIDDAHMKQTVYIFKCNNSTVHVKNKVNSITLDLCKKVAVVFESVVSGVEFINCQSVQAQVKHQLPTANIEKTDGCIIYLSKECLDCQIITAKSSEMNVCVPNDEGEFDEFPIVEQFKTTWNPATKKIVTECYDSVA